VIPLHALIPKLPVIAGIRPEKRSRGLDRLQCCWHVLYEFCGLSAEIIVHAQNEAEAREKAVDQLRDRGLKVVPLNVVPPTQLGPCSAIRRQGATRGTLASNSRTKERQ
jgi:hypothetical protein